ncbi:nuclear matrix constituent protein 1b-like [Nicotiana tomentosiformis]|uniref:nuclear matrix constituent protein 1b-like n=1 Tax=Nicotiana tomentosiformis TaxID=4098 RepID=UPI00388CBF07
MPHEGDYPFCGLFTGVEDVSDSSDASDLFHGVQHALNQVVAAHREACSRSRVELHRYNVDLQWVTEERNSLKRFLGKMGEVIKDLRAELTKAHQDQTDLSEQQKLELIGKLHEEVDVIKAESLIWKRNMDRFTAEKEAARAQLSSAESQLQRLKEKRLVQGRKTEELEVRLASELAKTEKTKADVDTFVVVYRADVEAAQSHAREVTDTTGTRAHWISKFAKCQSRRETLEEIHARGFNIS